MARSVGSRGEVLGDSQQQGPDKEARASLWHTVLPGPRDGFETVIDEQLLRIRLLIEAIRPAT